VRFTALFGGFRPGQWQSWQAIAGKAVPVSEPMIEILDFLVVRAGGQELARGDTVIVYCR
jgi:hypothetical protein